MLERRAAPVEREQIGFRGGDLGLGTRHVELGHVAGAEAPLGEVERVAIGGDGAAHERAFDVDRAQRQVRLGNFCLDKKTRALEQGLARLRIETRRVARPRELAEEIDLVAEIGADNSEVARRPTRAVHVAFDALGACGHAQLRHAVGIGDACDRSCLRKARGGDLDVGVVAIGACDEVIEIAIGEGPPPIAPRRRGGGSGHGPAAIALLERRGRLGKRR